MTTTATSERDELARGLKSLKAFKGETGDEVARTNPDDTGLELRPQVLDQQLRDDSLLIDRELGERHRRELALAVEYGRQFDPEREARVLKMQQANRSVPVGLIRENLENMESVERARGINIQEIMQSAPETAKLLRDPRLAGMIIDDVANLKGLEWMVKAGKVALAQGAAQMELAKLGKVLQAAEVTGADTTAIESRMTFLEEQYLNRYVGQGVRGQFIPTSLGTAKNLLTRGYVGALKQAHFLAGVGVSGFAGGVTFATGAAAAGQLGPQVFVPEELVTVPAGFAVGATTGSMLYIYDVESGHAYRQLRQAGLSPAQATLGATASGAANMTLERLSFGVAGRLFGKTQLGKMMRGRLFRIGTDRVGAAMKTPSFRRRIAGLVRDYGMAMGTEAATEFTQELTPLLAEAVLKRIEDGDWARSTLNENWGQAWTAALEAWEATAILGIVPVSGGVYMSAREVSRVNSTQATMQALGTAAGVVKLKARLPAAHGKFVENVQRGRPGADFVYISVDKWDEAFEKHDADPGEAAERVLGEGQSYAQAQSAGEADLLVPLGAWASQISGTPVDTDLMPHVRLYQEDRSFSEQQDRTKQHNDIVAELSDKGLLDKSLKEYTPDERTVYDAERASAIEAGRSQPEAESVARLGAQLLSNLARQEGMPLLSLYRTYEVRVFGPQQREAELRSRQRPERTLPAVTGTMQIALDTFAAAQERVSDVQLKIANQEFKTAPAGRAALTKAQQALVRAEAAVPFTEERRQVLSKQVALNQTLGSFRDATVKLFQGAFHGSRSRFEKFDITKVGTGERNARDSDIERGQGFGFYFSSKKEVAEWYRQNLSLGSSVSVGALNNIELYEDMARAFLESTGEVLRLQDFINSGLGRIELVNPEHLSRSQAIKAYVSTKLSDYYNKHQSNASNTPSDSESAALLLLKQDLRNAPARLRQIADEVSLWLDKNQDKITFRGQGSVVQAEIPEDTELLDWRIPVSAQSERVKAALGGLGIEESMRGENLRVKYLAATKVWVVLHDGGFLDGNISFSSAKEAREAMDARGGDALVVPRSGEEAYRELGRRLGQAQAASEALAAAGIPGHIYTSESGNKNYVIYDTERIEITQQLFQGNKIKKGMIEFTPGGRKFRIDLFKSANPSTLFHELSHVYLEMIADLSEREGASERIKNDYAIALKFLSKQTGKRIRNRQDLFRVQAKFKKQHHPERGPLEIWAAAWESYLRDGRAPTVELQDVFSTIRRWMLALGRSIGLTNLSPEIRGVFDRMIASDEEIETAQISMSLHPPPAVLDLMTDAELSAHEGRQQLAIEEDGARLTAFVLKETDRSDQDWFRDERTRITAEVESELSRVPLYRVLRYLERGEIEGMDELPKGISTKNGRARRLDASIIREQLGESELGGIPKKILWKSAGLPPDVLAEVFGFDGSLQMLSHIRNSDTYGEILGRTVQERIEQRFGNVLDDRPRLAREAVEAARSPRHIENMLVRMRVVRRQVDPSRREKLLLPDITELRNRARELVRTERLRMLRPHVWASRVGKNGRSAFRNAEAGKWEEAYNDQIRQVWAMEMFRAVRDAKESTGKVLRLARSTSRRAPQKRLGRAGYGFREHVNLKMEQYGLRRPDGREGPRESLREWIGTLPLDEQEVIIIDDRMLDDVEPKNIQDASVEEVERLGRLIRNLSAIAKNRTTILKDGRRVDRDKAHEEQLRSAQKHNKDRGPLSIVQRTSGLKKAQEVVHALGSNLIKVEEWFSRLDGRDPNGPWASAYWHPIRDARALENDLLVDLTQRVRQMFRRLPRKRRRRLFRETVYIESLDAEVPREFVVAVALNWGSESNAKRVLNGGLRGNVNLDVATVFEIMGHMDKEDAQLVNEIWELLDEHMWPKVETHERRMTGVPPPKIPARSFTLSIDGETTQMRGGYFPVVFDAESGGRTSDPDDIAVLFNAGRAKAMTAHGHTIERRDNVRGRPIHFSLDILSSHLQKVVHDLAFREPVVSIARSLNDDLVRETVQRYLGVAEHDQMVAWIKDVAVERTAADMGALEVLMGHLRSNVIYATMAFKATVTLQNFGNVANMLERVTPWRFSEALYSFVRHPKMMLNIVKQRSGFMRHRFGTHDRDLRFALQHLKGKDSVAADVLMYGYSSIMFTDSIIAYPGWLAAFRQGVKKGLTEKQAVRSADHIIATSLSSGLTEDLARVQRGGPYKKMLTMYYTWMSAGYNRWAALNADFNVSRRAGLVSLARFLPVAIARITAFAIAPALLGELLSGRPPDDERDEGWIEWAATEAAMYQLGMVPVIREASFGLEAVIKGEGRGSVRVGYIPVVAEELIAGTRLAKKALLGEEIETEDIAKRVNRAAGVIMKWPSSQAEVTGGYLWDWLVEEEETPEHTGEAIYDLIYRRTPKRGRRR